MIAEEVSSEDFLLTEDAVFNRLNTEDFRRGRFIYAGEGRIEIGREHFRYIGTEDGKDADLRFEISRMPCASVTKAMANEFYYDGIYHQFAVKSGPGHAMNLMMTVEALHDMTDADRRRAREDVRSGR
jgi:hypothetical protein